MKEKRGNTTKVPQELFRSVFFEEYHDLVTLLSKVMGLPTTAFFEEWMFYFIKEIIWGKTKLHWAKMISENLHNQLMVVKKSSKFYMTSYLVYLLVEKFPHKGLFRAGTLGTKKGEFKVYDCYP